MAGLNEIENPADGIQESDRNVKSAGTPIEVHKALNCATIAAFLRWESMAQPFNQTIGAARRPLNYGRLSAIRRSDRAKGTIHAYGVLG